ncbi:MAG TPA: c-type cytochrome [Actinomycetota bacterium]|nr:c-type cytochrome [Actinomycetota bacterium]
MAGVAVSGGVVLGLVAGAVAAAAILAGAVIVARRRPETLDIPPAMGPGPADEALERRNLEKLMGWGALSFIVMAIWVPVLWLREPGQNVTDENGQTRTAIDRGEQTTQNFQEGVNEFGFSCVRCHGTGLQGGTNYFQGGFVTVPRLTDVCGRLTIDQVKTTIMEGRANTDMPSWSVRFAGPLDDQQINDILQYLISVQTVPDEDNLCINPQAGATP